MARRTAVRTLCKSSRRIASGPEGSSAQSILCCAAGPPDRGRARQSGQSSDWHRAQVIRKVVTFPMRCAFCPDPATFPMPFALRATMSHLALARKWRPQRFEDVIGQRGVVDTLRNAIVTGRLAQSFIFAGPRGVGKTTTARILARALNCVNGPTPDPCGQCDACLEIAE